MITWTTLQSEWQNLVGDTTSAQLTAGKRDLNIAIRDIRAKMAGIFPLEDEYPVTTDTTNQYYPVPADFLRFGSATWTKSSIQYPLIEVKSKQKWALLNQVSTNTSNPPTHCHLRYRGGYAELGIWPLPSVASDANGLLLFYQPDPPDLTVEDTTIFAAVTNDLATVTSVGLFTELMVTNRRWMQVPLDNGDGQWYRMKTFTSTFSIALERKYQGPTNAGLTTNVAQIPLLPPNCDYLPAYFAAAHFFYRKRDYTKGNTMMTLYHQGIAENHSIWSNRSTLKTGFHGDRAILPGDPNNPPRNLTSI